MAAMQIVIKGKNLEVTPALRAYAEKKLSKFEKYLADEQETLAEMNMRTEKDFHIVELTIQVNGLTLRGESRTDDMYKSIDDAVDKIERQWDKFKTKIHKRLQRTKLSELTSPAQDEVTEKSSEDVEFRIVKTKRFAIKPMSVEEAIMQMELLGHDFFVFSNADNDQVNVVYKRRDGNYGLIEPEF